MVIGRPAGDSTEIGGAASGNSKAQTSPSPPYSDRNRTTSSGGTRRSTEVRLTLAGRLPPFIYVDVFLQPVAMAERLMLAEYPGSVAMAGDDRYGWIECRR